MTSNPRGIRRSLEKCKFKVRGGERTLQGGGAQQQLGVSRQERGRGWGETQAGLHGGGSEAPASLQGHCRSEDLGAGACKQGVSGHTVSSLSPKCRVPPGRQEMNLER